MRSRASRDSISANALRVSSSRLGGDHSRRNVARSFSWATTAAGINSATAPNTKRDISDLLILRAGSVSDGSAVRRSRFRLVGGGAHGTGVKVHVWSRFPVTRALPSGVNATQNDTTILRFFAVTSLPSATFHTVRLPP